MPLASSSHRSAISVLTAGGTTARAVSVCCRMRDSVSCWDDRSDAYIASLSGGSANSGDLSNTAARLSTGLMLHADTIKSLKYTKTCKLANLIAQWLPLLFTTEQHGVL